MTTPQVRSLAVHLVLELVHTAVLTAPIHRSQHGFQQQLCKELWHHLLKGSRLAPARVTMTSALLWQQLLPSNM